MNCFESRLRLLNTSSKRSLKRSWITQLFKKFGLACTLDNKKRKKGFFELASSEGATALK